MGVLRAGAIREGYLQELVLGTTRIRRGKTGEGRHWRSQAWVVRRWGQMWTSMIGDLAKTTLHLG